MCVLIALACSDLESYVMSCLVTAKRPIDGMMGAEAFYVLPTVPALYIFIKEHRLVAGSVLDIVGELSQAHEGMT